jgi:hypothetical protein
MMGFFGNGKHGTHILGKQTIPVSVGGSLAQIALYTLTIPANIMGENGVLRVYCKFGCTNSANTKLFYVKFGGTTMYLHGATATTFHNIMVHIANRNSLSAQIGGGTYTGGIGGTSTVALETATIDTSNDTTLVITGTTSLETGFTPVTTNMSGNGTTVTVIQTSHGLNTGDYVKASGSSTAGYNVDPITITKIDANTFTYLGTGTGTPATSPLIQRYSYLALETVIVELIR